MVHTAIPRMRATDSSWYCTVGGWQTHMDREWGRRREEQPRQLETTLPTMTTPDIGTITACHTWHTQSWRQWKWDDGMLLGSVLGQVIQEET